MSKSGVISFIKELESRGELIRIKSFVNPDLEITEIPARLAAKVCVGIVRLSAGNGNDAAHAPEQHRAFMHERQPDQT